MKIFRFFGTVFGLFLVAVAVTAVSSQELAEKHGTVTNTLVSVVILSAGFFMLWLCNRRARALLHWIGSPLAGYGGRLAQKLPNRFGPFTRAQVVMLAGAALLVAGMARMIQSERTLKAAYRSLESRSLSHDSSTYVRGRILVIQTPEGKVHPIHYDLPAQLRARSADEVGTVAEVMCAETRVASYAQPGMQAGSGSPGAYKRWCSVSLIDFAAGVRIGGVKTVSGSDPPTRKRRAGSAKGSRATPLVLQYLQNLPRRQP